MRRNEGHERVVTTMRRRKGISIEVTTDQERSIRIKRENLSRKSGKRSSRRGGRTIKVTNMEGKRTMMNGNPKGSGQI